MKPHHCLFLLLQQEAENFKKLSVISQDEFDTLTPKVPVDHSQEVPSLPMPGGVDSSEALWCLKAGRE